MIVQYKIKSDCLAQPVTLLCPFGNIYIHFLVLSTAQKNSDLYNKTSSFFLIHAVDNSFFLTYLCLKCLKSDPEIQKTTK